MNQKDQLLQKTIQELPTYQAPAQVWEQINDALEQQDKDNLIEQTIPMLPEFTAPDTLWAGIEQQLNVGGAAPRPLWRRVVRHPLSWAASFLLIAALFFLLRPTQTTEVTYAYTTATENQYLLEADWDADEADFAEVVQLHQHYLRTFANPQGKALQTEFSELNQARQELKQVLDQYGKDEEVIRQLAAVERARNQVINQMAQQI